MDGIPARPRDALASSRCGHHFTIDTFNNNPVLIKGSAASVWIWAFDRVGLTALPWPAPRTALHVDRPGDFLPSLYALQDSFYGLHELIGRVYYRLRYSAGAAGGV